MPQHDACSSTCQRAFGGQLQYDMPREVEGRGCIGRSEQGVVVESNVDWGQ